MFAIYHEKYYNPKGNWFGESGGNGNCSKLKRSIKEKKLCWLYKCTSRKSGKKISAASALSRLLFPLLLIFCMIIRPGRKKKKKNFPHLLDSFFLAHYEWHLRNMSCNQISGKNYPFLLFTSCYNSYCGKYKWAFTISTLHL